MFNKHQFNLCNWFITVLFIYYLIALHKLTARHYLFQLVTTYELESRAKVILCGQKHVNGYKQTPPVGGVTTPQILLTEKQARNNTSIHRIELYALQKRHDCIQTFI